ncbi:gamma-crystallin M2-like [Thunnus albacares]|uniref:gamma-crystallin M2-like n=1 Tax=Thunnus maccoyii TaxID=8240 RepID=UPI001C4D96CB|nr:gamma-crystallin M2-like [Thunnus maccoyii]XP_044233201.1 gamma-crystallin M2-like [Thunnus albacares]
MGFHGMLLGQGVFLQRGPLVVRYKKEGFQQVGKQFSFKSSTSTINNITAKMTSKSMNMMSKIIFYEERNFQGRSYECMSDCPDMSSYLNRCHSCRVERGCFIVYDRSNFMGNQYFMRRGEYADYMNMMGMSDCIRSCRMIPMHRGSFRMRIYERENFDGKMHELMEDCDNVMERFGMSNVMSCNVLEGHWMMYEQPQFRGRMMYMKPGEYRNFMIMGRSGMRVMSMRRIMDSCY